MARTLESLGTRNRPLTLPICDQNTSGGFGRLVTFDLAKSPILIGRDILCTTAMEYNSYISKGKTAVSVSFIIKIHQILSTYSTPEVWAV